MARIAIFCDGTWNSTRMGLETHVLRLARACAETSEQKVLYFAGVGTGKGMVNEAGRWMSKLGGGLFGWGLNRNIKSAYLALCRIYRPGDQILIFGFSRGAYTARSLAGMIRKCGIVADPTPTNVNVAFRLYRQRGPENAPDQPHILAARRLLSPHFATSPVDASWRNDHSYMVRISYLGVWDTVGALGIPKSLLGTFADRWNARHRFHDTTLSRLVETARHAVALDEQRVMYAPTLWSNLTDDQPDADSGLSAPNRSASYEQVWFAGNHAMVGGSALPQGLAAASLMWIWQGAEMVGLQLRPGARMPHVPVSAAEPAPDMYKTRAIYRLAPWLLRWRIGPAEPSALHPTARLRAACLTGYRPGSLSRVIPGLFRQQ